MSHFPLSHPTEPKVEDSKPPADYAAALKQMRKVASAGNGSGAWFERRVRLWRQVDAQQACQIIDPLLEHALAEPDPWERNHRLIAARLSDMVHRELEDFDEELCLPMNADRDLASVISEKRLEEALLGLVTTITPLSRECCRALR